MNGTDLRLSPKTREVLDWLDARRRETDTESDRLFYTGVTADAAGDSSAAANRIDSVIPPADQLSPGSVGGLRSIEGIVR